MKSVLGILQPSQRQRCGAPTPTPGDAAGSAQPPTAALARGNFTLCLPGQKAGLNAAKVNGGQKSISYTRVKSEEESVGLDSRLKREVRRSGGDSASIAEPQWLERQRTALQSFKVTFWVPLAPDMCGQ